MKSKLSNWFLIWFIRSLFCKHKYVFYDNIYGDEINDCGGKRSKWICTKCGKLKYKNELVKAENGELYPNKISIEMMKQLGYSYNINTNEFTKI